MTTTLFPRAKTLTLTAIVILISMVALSGKANAQLQSKNDAVHGNGSITADLNTGLEWLDLTKSQSRSFNDVAGNLGSAGDFAGFQIANTADLENLFSSAGATAPFTVANYPQTNGNAIWQATDLLGVTWAAGFSKFAQGYFDDGTTGNVGAAYLQYALTITNGNQLTVSGSRAAMLADTDSASATNSKNGVWLHRYGNQRNSGGGANASVTLGGGPANAGGINVTFPTVVTPGVVTNNKVAFNDLDPQVQADFANIANLLDHPLFYLNFSGEFTGNYSLELGLDPTLLAAANVTSDLLRVVKRGESGEITYLVPIATTASSVTVEADSFSTFGFVIVPEPAAGALAWIGTVVILAGRRRSRRAAGRTH